MLEQELLDQDYTLEIAQRIQHLDGGVALAHFQRNNGSSTLNNNSRASASTAVPEWNPPPSTSCGGRRLIKNTSNNQVPPSNNKEPVIDLSVDPYDKVTIGKHLLLFILLFQLDAYCLLLFRSR
jgi:hypothetical protein